MSDITKPEAASIQERFAKLLADSKMPSLDARTILEIHKKNVDLLSQATRIWREGVTAIRQRQQEILQNALEQAAAIAPERAAAGRPQKSTAAQQKLLKRTRDTELADARELAELAEKANREVAEVIHRQMTAWCEEIGQTLPDNKGGPVTSRHTRDPGPEN